MPVQKFSAMDPSGSWNMDARDQAAMWNADRGDRINMWQQNRIDQRGQDDWRRDVALQTLNLDRDKWSTGRQDIKDRDAAYYAWQREMFGVDKADRDVEREMRVARHNLGMDADEIKLEEARDASTRRRNAANYWQTQFDPTALGVTDPKVAATLKTMAAQDPSIAQQYLAATINRGLNKQFEPEERADAGQRARADEAAAIIASIQGKDTITPVEKQKLALARAEREKQGYGAGLGVDPQDATAAEYAKTQLEAISKSAKEAASGIFGIVTQSERDALKKQASELLRVLKRAGYQDAALNEVWSQIESDLKQTQTGLLGDTFMSPGWTSSDIDEARRGFR